ncbi:MAG: asparaginase, partial [Candidatus Thermoplasmatota archaeon]|nr:asparaginase [Candidatus Thermoplasmatota archaeon]
MTEQDRPSSVSHGRPGSRIYPSNPLGEKYEGIPTGRDVEWEPLVDFRRLDVSENTIHGAISWVHGDEVIHSFGGNVLVYGRSMMKPLLMKIFTDVLDDVLTDKQKAIACSSHNGDTEHVATAQSILTESEWGLMQCPLDVPLVQFGRQVRRPRRWFHTCSGEHAALLRALRLKGINRAGYTLPTSSWFQDFIDLLNSMLHPDWKPLRIAK